MFHQQIGIAHGQHAAAYAHRSASKKRIGCRLHGVRQLHTTNVEVLRRAQHATLHIGVMGVLGAGGQDDLLAITGRLLRVHPAVEGRVFFAGNALAGVQDCVKGFTGMVGKPSALRQSLRGQPVVQQKINGLSEGHGFTLKRHCEARRAEAISQYRGFASLRSQ